MKEIIIRKGKYLSVQFAKSEKKSLEMAIVFYDIYFVMWLVLP